VGWGEMEGRRGREEREGRGDSGIPEFRHP